MYPVSLYQALALLKQNNALFKDVNISIEFVPWDLLDFSNNGDARDIENSNESLKKTNNLLHSYNFTSQETMFIPHIVTSEEISIAPGKGKEPVSIFKDNYCEELAFPCLVPTGKFGYKVEKKLKTKPS